MITDLLRVSGTNVLPVNTHGMESTRAQVPLQIGYGGVTPDQLAQYVDVSSFVTMININLATTASEAVRRTKRAFQLTGSPTVKLEVLDSDERTSNDAYLLDAIAQLARGSDRLSVMPLIGNDVETAKAAVALGCPLLRVMGSPIGSEQGLLDTNTFETICGLGVPVVLDGGVGTPEDYASARRLGASGILINSVLFQHGERTPQVIMGQFVAGMESYEARGL